MVKANLNIQAIESAAKDAFKDACLFAHTKIIEVISEPGAFPSTPEDIIDDGILKGAQQPPEFSVDGTVATFRNVGTDYALYVYLGYTLRNGTEVEGRPWIAEGIKRADLERTIAILLKAKLL